MDSQPLTLFFNDSSLIFNSRWRSIFFGLGSHLMKRSQPEQTSFWLWGGGASLT
ncbi:hypothetical protein [Planktothrix agardhii]|uniref:hypothetical protein n=1 Tax=Planktothrix agardhii TaxID=1160 RepID=UPI001D0A47A9|nr:hypothetical protein [Planktothrix agardhii]MCF3578679.1 hypothetical protein [Planktothrix agardhii 1812]MCF3614255.1 hypothetical protein [Planktothrix agardhii 1027]MCF3647890.1 hypothetical protein [Planktothrix agardhii 1026]MEA5561386.1 hypothetical protein [Planktothrix agardhii UHCC 0887]